MGKPIKLSDRAYDYLRTVSKQRGESMEALASHILLTFLDPKLKYSEEKDAFQLYDTALYIELERYMTHRHLVSDPLLEALIEMADGKTWKKFGEKLEKVKKPT
jgi:hypothetical protein